MIVGNDDPLFHRRVHIRFRPGALVSFAFLILAFFTTLPLASLQAAEKDPLVLTGPANVETLGRYFEYTIDDAWETKSADFAGPTPVETRPMPGPIPDFGYTPARIWLRLDLVNGAPDIDQWRFFAHANFTQQIAVYKLGPDGTITTLMDLTEDSPFSARPLDSPQMVAPFDLAPGEAATLLVSYYSQGSSRMSMTIETVDSFADLSRTAAAKNYVFYGMMLVMIALATVALVSLRQLVFAAYAGYLVSILAYIAHGDGTAFQFVWSNFPRFNSNASVVAGSGVMIFGALFAISFLQTKRYHPVMHRLLQGVIAAVLLVDIVLWPTDPQLLKRLLILMISASVLTFIAAGLVAARTRFREVRFYLLAWFASLIPAAMLTARLGFGLETTIITPYDATRIALAIDALMMGLAIFDSYNHQRQTAMQQTIAHAERNLALGQRLALLEESYAQVSADAREREESVKDTVHDLRQPMHALRLSLRQMFAAGKDGKSDAGQVESALAYMENLVAERLADRPAAASADTKAAAPDPSEPGLHGVLRGVADMFAPEAAEKGLDLKLVLAAPDAKVAAYPLMRVVANLVSNAIKYTRQGRVVIGLRRDGKGHRIEIHDTGPGLNAAEFQQALQRNERLERDLDAADGSGLGLSVVKDIAAEHQWRLSACDHRRTGATIRLSVPD